MPSYKGHRYPVEIINHCVWLYFRFTLSFREVEELMLARGVVVSYETIRRWCAKFGQTYANQLRRRRPQPGDKWYLDEVFIKINGTLHTCGGRSTRTATCSTCLSSHAETARQPRRSSDGYSRGCGAAGDRHRQARQLPGGAPRDAGLGRASPVEVFEQPGREFSSADPTAGAGDETVHIAWARATIPVRFLGYLTAFPILPTQTLGARMAC